MTSLPNYLYRSETTRDQIIQYSQCKLIWTLPLINIKPIKDLSEQKLVFYDIFKIFSTLNFLNI